jgi:hypothetical protein
MANENARAEGCWHASDKSTVAHDVAQLGGRLWVQDSWRRNEIGKNLKRFNGMSRRGMFSRGDSLSKDNVRMNITKSAIETLESKVGSNRPRPRVLTTGADYALRIRAKKLQRFLDAQFKALDLFGVGKMAFRDALLTGTGLIQFFPDVGKRTVVAERVFPAEVLVDLQESATSLPRNMMRAKTFDKGVLTAMFPKFAKDIENAMPVSPLDDTLGLVIQSDDSITMPSRVVRVFEAWYLATTDADGDLVPGRHVIAIDGVNKSLRDEPYEYDYFPFAVFHWVNPVLGFWGDSAAAEIRGLEREANILLQRVQRAMKLAGQITVFSPMAAKIPKDKFSDEIMNVVEYQGGVPPQYTSGQPVHPQVLQQVWDLKRQCFEQLGTNEYQASASRPPGIESGRALEQLSEEHLVRFKSVSQNYEKFLAVDCTRHIIRVAKELDAELKERGHSEGYVVRSVGKNTALKIKWDEAAVSPDDLFVETWPASILPVTPSGKTEEVERWQANGWVSPQRAMSLLDFPDLESESDLATADTELVEWQMDQMLDEGEDVVPDPRQNLAYALQRGTYAKLWATRNGVDMQNIDRLEYFLMQVQELQAQANPPPPPMPMTGALPLPGPVGPAPMPGLAAPGAPVPVTGGM